MKRLLAWFRRRICSHAAYMDDMRIIRNAKGERTSVQCPCHKCGLVMEADCGLHMPCRWSHRPK